MTNEEKEDLEHNLQVLAISFDALYARCLIGISKGSVYLTEEVFDELAKEGTVVRLDGGHYSGKTKNGLRITTIRD